MTPRSLAHRCFGTNGRGPRQGHSSDPAPLRSGAVSTRLEAVRAGTRRPPRRTAIRRGDVQGLRGSLVHANVQITHRLTPKTVEAIATERKVRSASRTVFMKAGASAASADRSCSSSRASAAARAESTRRHVSASAGGGPRPLRRAAQWPHRGSGSGEQCCALSAFGAREPPLEQLAHDAEGEVRLELGPAGSQDLVGHAPPPAGRPRRPATSSRCPPDPRPRAPRRHVPAACQPPRARVRARPACPQDDSRSAATGRRPVTRWPARASSRERRRAGR